LLGLVRPVGIHFDQYVIARVQTPLEACQIRRAEALLTKPVHDVNVVIVAGDLVCQLASAIG
jgi:hypothetical protein